MLDENKFICNFCNEIIGAKEVVEVQSVDRNCCNTGEVILYFHLYTDKSSRHSKHYGGKGCYWGWVDSDDSFTPHGVRKVLKQEILENLSRSD